MFWHDDCITVLRSTSAASAFLVPETTFAMTDHTPASNEHDDRDQQQGGEMTQDSNKQSEKAPPKPRVLLSASECASKEEFIERAKAALRAAGILKDKK